MKITRSPRQLGSATPQPARTERPTNYSPTGAAGEASMEQVELDATAAWLKHVQAGRIG